MPIKKYSLLFTLLSTLIFTVSCSAQDYTIKTLATDLGVPWGMAILPNNKMLIAQREGLLHQLDLTTGEILNITGLPQDIKVKGQGGLFDIRLAPNYESTKWIYLSYAKNVSGQGSTALIRVKLTGTKLSELQEIITTQSRSSTNVHFGGRITFDQTGHVFLSVGDRGIRDNAQNLLNHAGSILRLNLDGTIPQDNPFKKSNHALAEIWSYGHRNPQGLFYNNKTEQLWAIEHGPRGGDEINLINAASNYGWPIISYGREYDRDVPVGVSTTKQGMQQPVKVYIPSIAPSGLIQYLGNAFPNWKGDLLTGSMKQRHINKVRIDKQNQAIEEKRMLREVKGRIRNIIEGPKGLVYISTDDGRILTISPKPANP